MRAATALQSGYPIVTDLNLYILEKKEIIYEKAQEEAARQEALKADVLKDPAVVAALQKAGLLQTEDGDGFGVLDLTDPNNYYMKNLRLQAQQQTGEQEAKTQSRILAERNGRTDEKDGNTKAAGKDRGGTKRQTGKGSLQASAEEQKKDADGGRLEDAQESGTGGVSSREESANERIAKSVPRNERNAGEAGKNRIRRALQRRILLGRGEEPVRQERPLTKEDIPPVEREHYKEEVRGEALKENTAQENEVRETLQQQEQTMKAVEHLPEEGLAKEAAASVLIKDATERMGEVPVQAREHLQMDKAGKEKEMPEKTEEAKTTSSPVVTKDRHDPLRDTVAEKKQVTEKTPAHRADKGIRELSSENPRRDLRDTFHLAHEKQQAGKMMQDAAMFTHTFGRPLQFDNGKDVLRFEREKGEEGQDETFALINGKKVPETEANKFFVDLQRAMGPVGTAALAKQLTAAMTNPYQGRTKELLAKKSPDKGKAQPKREAPDKAAGMRG